MPRKLVTARKFIGPAKRSGKASKIIRSESSPQSSGGSVRDHYKKVVNVKADLHSSNPDRDYYFRQIYSPDEAENPLKGKWNRAKHLRSVGYDYGKPTLVVMSPQEFLDLVPAPHPAETEWKLKEVKEEFESGKWETRDMINEGPFMDIDKTGHVVTHEGRHRAMVLRDLGYKEFPVLIYDRSKRDESWRELEPWMKEEVAKI